MKKILFALIALVSFTVANAQIVNRSKKTITGADTATLNNVASKVVSLTATYLETSGTSAGKFYFEGSVDGLSWQHIDSTKSLSDVATYQSLTVASTATIFVHYRVRCSNTSAATGTLWFYALRRPDDK